MAAWVFAAMVGFAPTEVAAAEPSILVQLPVLLVPFAGPIVVLESRRGEAELEYYAPYPYANGENGVLRIDRIRRKPGRKRFALQGAVDVGILSGLSEDRLRQRVALRLQGPTRFELRGALSSFGDRTKFGLRPGPVQTDVTGAVRFAESQRMHFVTGLGLTHIGDRLKSARQGVHMLYGVALYPERPFTVEAQVRAGALSGELLFDWRVRGGVALGRVELFLGYSSQRVSTLTEGGYHAGLRLWV